MAGTSDFAWQDPRKMRRQRTFGAVSAALLLVLLPLSAAPKHSPAAPPRLVVIVSVDGLSWARLDGYRTYFSGGLKRLLDEGRVHTQARYRHLNTETGPGHASLGTGAPPRVTGIVANRWFEERAGKMAAVYCTDQWLADDRSAPKTSVDVPSPFQLQAPSLADAVVDANPGSRVVSLSGKDRGAIFLAGRSRQHAVYWYDRAAGRFTTSRWYDSRAKSVERVPPLVRQFNRESGGLASYFRFGAVWRELPAPAAELPRGPVSNPEEFRGYQLPIHGLDFDHDLTTNVDGYFDSIYHSPFVDELLADLAVSVLEDDALALGRRDVPDVLALSFSAQDTVSHQYGSESRENFDTLRRLDRQLARLLEALETPALRGRVVLAFSADHGFQPVPEYERRKPNAEKGGRLVYANDSATQYPNVTFLDRLNRVLAADLCLPAGSRPVKGSDGWNLFYDRPELPKMTVDKACAATGQPEALTSAAVDAKLPDAVAKLFSEEIEKVLVISKERDWGTDEAAEFARNALFSPRSGEAMLIPRKNVLMHWDPARGSGHGSHHETETHVPLIFWGAGVGAKAAVSDPAAPYDLAPTLARLVGVALPKATGKALPLAD